MNASTSGLPPAGHFAVSPDGRRLAVELSPDGTRATVALLDPGRRTRDLWSIDLVRGGDINLWVLPFAGDRKPFAFLRSQFGELRGRFSPDSRWVTYSSNESGQIEV